MQQGVGAHSDRLGVVVDVVQAATPLAFWWLDPATVYALGLAVIAAIYIGSLVWEVPLLTCGRSVQESSFRVVREF